MSEIADESSADVSQHAHDKVETGQEPDRVEILEKRIIGPPQDKRGRWQEVDIMCPRKTSAGGGK